MDSDVKLALEMHAEADQAAFHRFDDRFDHLHDKIDENHKELLVAITEMKAAKEASGMKSGIITSGVVIAAIEAFKQFFTK